LGITANKSFDIEVSAFGNANQLLDWENEVAWVFPLVMLNMETVDVLRIHASRLAKISGNTAASFELCAEAFLQRSNGTTDEVDSMRSGMAALQEAASFADPQSVALNNNRSLREALWEALEAEALALEPVRKALDKEVSTFLKDLDSTPTNRILQAQTLLEEALVEAPLERAHLIRESRRHLREAMSVDGVTLDPIFWAEIGWMNWQASTNEAESMEWFNGILKGVEGSKMLGLAVCARLHAYFLAKHDFHIDAYRWSKIAADLWPCVGTYHERARHAVSAATKDVAKRELVAFIKISEMGADLIEICVARQQQIRQKAQIAVGEWELTANTVEEVLELLPGIPIPNELISGAALAKAGLENADFLTAAQTLIRATDGKASLNRSVQAGIQSERRKRTEALMMARQTVEALMQQRDDMLKTSTDAHDEEINGARAALLEAEDNSKAQRGCGMGMGGGCAILVVYMIVSFMLSGHGMALGPGTPMGMVCIGISLVPLVASIIYYVGCMSRRMVLESKLCAQIAEAQKAYDLTRSQANSKFRSHLESAKSRVTQEEQLLQHAEAVAKQFGC
jgi:cell division septum initiation protein DivIVA